MEGYLLDVLAFLQIYLLYLNHRMVEMSKKMNLLLLSNAIYWVSQFYYLKNFLHQAYFQKTCLFFIFYFNRPRNDTSNYDFYVLNVDVDNFFLRMYFFDLFDHYRLLQLIYQMCFFDVFTV